MTQWYLDQSLFYQIHLAISIIVAINIIAIEASMVFTHLFIKKQCKVTFKDHILPLIGMPIVMAIVPWVGLLFCFFGFIAEYINKKEVIEVLCIYIPMAWVIMSIKEVHCIYVREKENKTNQMIEDIIC